MVAKKSLGNIAEQTQKNTKKLTDENRNDEKRLTFPVSGADHTRFKKEAADAGLSMSDYFMRLWKKGR
jgi:predicted DNA binding CopG/RHH family protein